MIKTVVVGAGQMGRRNAQAIALANNFSFEGICDLQGEALSQAQAEGIPSEKCFTDIDELFRHAKPHCAIISTTTPSHFPLAMKAIEHGVQFLLVEKPFCSSLSQVKALQQRCENSGIRLAVNHGIRFAEQYQQIKKMCGTPGLGDLCSMTLSAGNMGLAMNGSHMFELFHFLTGETPESATAWFMPDPQQNPRGEAFRDAAGQVRLVTPSGKRLYLEIGPDQFHGLSFSLNFRYGQVFVDLLSKQCLLNRRKEEFLALPSTRYGMPCHTESHPLSVSSVVELSAKVLEAMETNENYPDGKVGERIIRTLVAAYLSHERGHIPVAIYGEMPEEREFAWA